MARVSSVGDDDIIKFIEGPDGTPVTVAGAEHEITVADLATSLGVGSGTVMDSGYVSWRFEAVPFGGTGSANPVYPEIVESEGGGWDLSTLPAVVVDGGVHLLAAYSATSKNVTALPDGAGGVMWTLAMQPVGVPDAALTLGLTCGDHQVNVAVPVEGLESYVGTLNGSAYSPMFFSSGTYTGYAGSLTVELTSGAALTTGSYLMTIYATIHGFVPTTHRDTASAG